MAPPVNQRVQLGERLDLGHRNQVVAAKPADLALDAALLVGAADAWLAAEGFPSSLDLLSGLACGDDVDGDAKRCLGIPQ